MNNRYFGNIHDFCKYGLLRLLGEHLSLGVCWMLTPGVGKPEGSGYGYLVGEDPFKFRRRDSELFNWLLEKRREWSPNGGEWGVGMIEKSGMIPKADYFSKPMPSIFGEREEYFREMQDAFKFPQGKERKDIVFLDPDFGVGYTQREFTGERGNGYLHAGEIARCLHDGFSVLFYQDWHQDWHRKYDRMDPESRETPEVRIRAALRQEGFRPRILSLEANAVFEGRRAPESGRTLARFFLVQHDKHVVKVEKFAESFRNSCWCKGGPFVAPRARIGVFIDVENIGNNLEFGALAYREAMKRGDAVRVVAAGKNMRAYRLFYEFLHNQKRVDVRIVGSGKNEADYVLSSSAIEVVAEGKVDEIVVISADKLFRLDAKWAHARNVRYIGIGRDPSKAYADTCDEFGCVLSGKNGPYIRWHRHRI